MIGLILAFQMAYVLRDYGATLFIAKVVGISVTREIGPLIAAILVPGVLFAGGVGAFIQTYRVWKFRGTWPIWHGAGWFLFMLFLLCLSVPGSALTD